MPCRCGRCQECDWARNHPEVDAGIICPFCGEDDFDLVGLKHHIQAGQCDAYNNTDAIGEFEEADHA